jgi:5-formyltetrahydrofolate cyclo-ligase
MTDKDALRRRMRALRKEHVAALPAQASALMFHRPPVPVANRVPEGATVGLYHAHGAEAPSLGYARWFHENGRRVALPRFASREAPMRFALWADPFVDGHLEPGPWRAMQPLADARQTVPDIVFVPLLAFTADGERLGQGGGHYDRWLEANPGTTAIGMAWDCQRVDSLPTEPHDRALDAIVTPTRLYEGTN